MYAEIRITVVDGLSSSLDRQAREWFAPTVLPLVAAARMESGEDLLHEAEAIVAKHLSTHMMLILRDDAATLRTLVQAGFRRPTLSGLKQIAEETVDDVSRFLRAHGMRVATVRIWIVAEGEHIETGRRITWWDSFLTAARKEVAGRLSVPVATFLASLALDSDMPKAAVSAAAAFIGVIVWLLVSATLEKPGYRYE